MLFHDMVDSFINYVNSFGYDCYLVGGALRNYYLGLSASDFDFVVDTTIDNIIECLKEFKPKRYSNKHTLGVWYNGYHIEVTEINGSLANDLISRDFTMNSLIYSPNSGVIDNFNGLSDINNRIIRAIDNNIVFDKPIRILRALRFRAKYELIIDKSLSDNIHKSYTLIESEYGLKMDKELEGIINSNMASSILTEYFDLFSFIFPSLNNNLRVLDFLPSNFVIRLAAILNEVDAKLSLFGVNKENIALITKLINYKNYDIKDYKDFIYEFGRSYLDYYFILKRALYRSENKNTKELDLEEEEINRIINSGELIYLSNLVLKSKHLYKMGYYNSGYILNDVLALVRKNILPNDIFILKKYVINNYKI